MCQAALTNVRRGVDASARFPRNVFVGDWADFFFFESDWMRDEEFVGHLKALLAAESGECGCICNLDAKQDQPGTCFVNARTPSSAYRAVLWPSEEPASGWLASMDRLGCASTTGDWCMYCEPKDELGVMAIRRSDLVATYMPVLAGFHADRIANALATPMFFGMSEIARSPWRKELLREYVSSSS